MELFRVAFICIRVEVLSPSLSCHSFSVNLIPLDAMGRYTVDGWPDIPAAAMGAAAAEAAAEALPIAVAAAGSVRPTVAGDVAEVA